MTAAGESVRQRILPRLARAVKLLSAAGIRLDVRSLPLQKSLLGGEIDMVIKVIGSIAVLSACGGLGFFCAGEMERRIRQLKELKGAMLLVKGDIRYLKSSLPEAFASASIREKGDFACFFGSVARQLDGLYAASIEDAFLSASSCLKDTALKKQDISMLVNLGSMLGKMDADMQLNALEWYLEQLGELADDLGREVGKKTSLSKSLGVLGGIFLLVVLL